MRKAAVRDGDSTTTGGFVMGSSTRITDHGKKIALDDDLATCGNCKGVHKLSGTGKGISDKGRNVVVDGDRVLCPCGKNRVIVGSNPGYFLSTDCEVVSTKSAGAPEQAGERVYDEGFRLVDEHDTPLVNCYYAIRGESGRSWSGHTDSDGLTERVCTNRPERLSVTIRREDSNE